VIPRAIVLDKEHNIYDFKYSPGGMSEAVKELKKLGRK
jgi:hypothetical protein